MMERNTLVCKRQLSEESFKFLAELKPYRVAVVVQASQGLVNAFLKLLCTSTLTLRFLAIPIHCVFLDSLLCSCGEYVREFKQCNHSIFKYCSQSRVTRYVKVNMNLHRVFNVQLCMRVCPRQHISTQPVYRTFLRSLWTVAKPSKPQVPHRLVTNPLANANLPTKTWIDRLPAKARPYFYLTRIDKPAGTFLLFYPCGSSHMLRFPSES